MDIAVDALFGERAGLFTLEDLCSFALFSALVAIAQVTKRRIRSDDETRAIKIFSIKAAFLLTRVGPNPRLAGGV